MEEYGPVNKKITKIFENEKEMKSLSSSSENLQQSPQLFLYCYLRKIPRKAKESELKNFIKKYMPQIYQEVGEIKFEKLEADSRINNGRGKIGVKSKEAFNILNNSPIILRGTKLKVNSCPPKAIVKSQAENNRVYFYGNMNKIKDEELKKSIPKEFQVERLMILKQLETGKSKNFGFFDFSSMDEAKNIELYFKNHPLFFNKNKIEFLDPNDIKKDSAHKFSIEWRLMQKKLRKKILEKKIMKNKIAIEEKEKNRRWKFLKPSTHSFLNTSMTNYYLRPIDDRSIEIME